ncbi:Mce protein [Nocardia sp. CDC159]|uniref:Mce protein n=1 Tax=Nocardia pulmonis TaxID=2951408 RepID=A0A9X2E6T9_9NOCA|nr:MULTISPECIES: Mce protein [Nocardia]MCM6772573.1 Mce protein [Nocardia pulmonis]MCM6784769.1 Mce protein [Nocardia sp. CDC159]
MSDHDITDDTPDEPESTGATAESDAESSEEGVDDGPSRTRRRYAALRVAAIATAVVLLLGLTAATAILGWKYTDMRAVQAAAEQARRAAADYAVTLTSVDTANLDANFKSVLDGSTGEFRDVYSKSSTQLRQLLIDHKATGHGVVLQSAVQSASENEAVVLLFVDQTVTNTEMPDPRIDHSRIVMTMQRVGGQWKAAKVDIP